jgi:hypothetical protein
MKYSKRINALINKHEYDKAREWICVGLEYLPDDHWLLDRMSLTFYEQGKYAEALQWSEKAYQHAKSCPMVLWGLADTLDVLGHKKRALTKFLRLFELTEKAIAGQETKCEWEGDERGFLADAAYRICLCYEYLRRLADAKNWLLKYQHMIEQQWPTVYSRQVAAETWRRLFPPVTSLASSSAPPIISSYESQQKLTVVPT